MENDKQEFFAVRENKQSRYDKRLIAKIVKEVENGLPRKEALQKALKEAELKITALNTLIDVAEEQLKIDIRKKPGAKQS